MRASPTDALLFDVNPICDSFERALQEGSSPKIEDHLDGWRGEHRRVLFQQLLDIEIYFRRTRNLAPDLDDYRRRFPDYGSTIAATFELRGITSAASDPLAARSRFGNYTIERELGRGGMGIVYVARHAALERSVALKVLPALAQLRGMPRRRFESEARAIARLQHGNIVPIYDVGEVDGQPYYSMRLIDGQTLGQSIASASSRAVEGGQPESTTEFRDRCRDAAQIVLQVARALHYAHERGVIHRDIKPSNLMVDGEGVAWLLDFGLARVDDSDLTTSRDLLGTVRYMPPERFEGDCSAAGDVYSLGLTLYETIALHPAYTGPDQAAIMRAILAGSPPSLRTHAPRISADLATIVATATARSRSHRYPSAGALAEDIERFLDDRPIRARRTALAERAVRWARRNPAPSALGLVLAASTVGAMAAATNLRRQRDEIAEQKAAIAGLTAAERELLVEVSASRDELREALYRSDMERAALAAFSSADSARVSQILERWEPTEGTADLRGWEWRLFRAWVARSELQLSDAVANGASWRPDGSRLATTGRSVGALWDSTGSVRVADLRTSAHPRTPRWSPDGRFVATWDMEGVKVFDADGMTVAARPQTHNVHFAWLGSDRLIVRDLDAAYLAWRFETGDEEILPWPAGGSAFAEPAGLRFVRTAGKDAIIGEVETGSIFHAFTVDADLVGPAEFDPTGVRVAAACRADAIHVWDTSTGRESLTIERAHLSTINSVTWSPDGASLVSGSFDGDVKVWDAQTGRLLRRLNGHEGEVSAASFAPTRDLIASVSSIGQLRRWDVSRAPAHRVVPTDPQSRPTDLAWDIDGRRIATRDSNHLRIWDVSEVDVALVADEPSMVLSYSPDRRRFAQLHDDHTTLHDASTGETIAQVEGDAVARQVGKRWRHEWTTDGTLCVVNGVRVTTISSDGEIRELASASDLDASLSPAGRRLALRLGYGKIILRDLASGSEVELVNDAFDWSYPNGVPTPYFSPDGARLAITNGSRLILYDIATGAWMRSFHDHGDRITHAAWSPDGSRIATTGEDRVVVLTDPEGGRLARLPIDGRGARVAWSPDGSRLAALADQNLHVWDTDPASR